MHNYVARNHCCRLRALPTFPITDVALNVTITTRIRTKKLQRSLTIQILVPNMD